MYNITHAKMTKPIYVVNNKSSYIQIQYDPAEAFNCNVLNFIGYGWQDIKYELVKKLLKSFWKVATDTDLIAHDDYIAKLNPLTTVIFIQGVSEVSASKKRILLAKEKLEKHGFKCRYFVNEKAFKNYLNKVKGDNK